MGKTKLIIDNQVLIPGEQEAVFPQVATQIHGLNTYENVHKRGAGGEGGVAGDTRGNERGFDQSFATTVRGKHPMFALYRQKRDMK